MGGCTKPGWCWKSCTGHLISFVEHVACVWKQETGAVQGSFHQRCGRDVTTSSRNVSHTDWPTSHDDVIALTSRHVKRCSQHTSWTGVLNARCPHRTSNRSRTARTVRALWTVASESSYPDLQFSAAQHSLWTGLYVDATLTEVTIRVVHGLGWTMGCVGLGWAGSRWVDRFQFLVGWVGSTIAKVLQFETIMLMHFKHG